MGGAALRLCYDDGPVLLDTQMARETPVFVSYARVDERYATELMSRLAKEPDIAPWQDRISMSPGDFEDQIKAGIESSDYLFGIMPSERDHPPGVLRSKRHDESGRKLSCSAVFEDLVFEFGY